MALKHWTKAFSGQMPPFDEVIQVARRLDHDARASGAAKDVEDAVAAWERAVNHPDFGSAPNELRALILTSAGEMWLIRSTLTGLLEHADTGITLLVQATSLSVRSPEAAPRMHFLGRGMMIRYAIRGAGEDLDEAIGAFEAALDPGITGPLDRADVRDNLAEALRARYELRRSSADLDRAIDLLGGG